VKTLGLLHFYAEAECGAFREDLSGSPNPSFKKYITSLYKANNFRKILDIGFSTASTFELKGFLKAKRDRRF